MTDDDQTPSRNRRTLPPWLGWTLAIIFVVGIWNLQAWARSSLGGNPEIPTYCELVLYLNTDIDASEPETVRHSFEESVRLAERGAERAPREMRADLELIHDVFAEASTLLAAHEYSFAEVARAESVNDPRLQRLFDDDVATAIGRVTESCRDLAN